MMRRSGTLLVRRLSFRRLLLLPLLLLLLLLPLLLLLLLTLRLFSLRLALLRLLRRRRRRRRAAAGSAAPRACACGTASTAGSAGRRAACSRALLRLPQHRCKRGVARVQLAGLLQQAHSAVSLPQAQRPLRPRMALLCCLAVGVLLGSGVHLCIQLLARGGGTCSRGRRLIHALHSCGAGIGSGSRPRGGVLLGWRRRRSPYRMRLVSCTPVGRRGAGLLLWCLRLLLLLRCRRCLLGLHPHHSTQHRLLAHPLHRLRLELNRHTEGDVLPEGGGGYATGHQVIVT